MPFTVTCNTEADCIFVSVEGELNLTLLESMAAEVVQCIKEHGCRRVLNDLRQARLTQ